MSTLPPIGLITGLSMERRALKRLRGQGVVVTCSGIGPRRARAAAERLLAEGATALISAGTAGGLTDTTAPGHLMVPAAVVSTEGVRLDADAEWHAAVLDALAPLDPDPGRLLGSDLPILTEAEKRRLGREMDCLAVDMESHAVGAVAAQAGVPFLALRVVTDTVDRQLPAALGQAFTRQGELRPGGLLLGLARRPWELGQMGRLKKDADAAMATLRHLARLPLPRPAAPPTDPGRAG
ncbi:hypothetical protein [Roseospirillum parvum]|uniref:Adenosylhomocysteine nucleosidase n=1 Tax=Roseospirillum parvum TaxID=83401 RepID=A0A1G7XSZ2_9PROT|nr:hypothetical protein [Roseospirillum parvum]SDG86830.1 adenosylhomocysteine nucleosidase [Roseospirillum parvum]